MRLPQSSSELAMSGAPPEAACTLSRMLQKEFQGKWEVSN